MLVTQGGGTCSWQCGRPGLWGARGPQRVHAGRCQHPPPVGTQRTLMGGLCLLGSRPFSLPRSFLPLRSGLGLFVTGWHCGERGPASWVQLPSAQMGKLRPRGLHSLRASASFPDGAMMDAHFPGLALRWGPVLSPRPQSPLSAVGRLTPPPTELSAMPGLGLPCLPSLLLASHTCPPRPSLLPAGGGGAL